MADDKIEADRLAEEAARAARSRENLARSKFVAPLVEPPAPQEPEQAKGPPVPDYSQPPTFDEHVHADACKFERRREDVREFCAANRQAEIKAMEGRIETPDPDMAKYLADEVKKVEEVWAEREAKRLASIDRDQQLALERTRALYGRDD